MVIKKFFLVIHLAFLMTCPISAQQSASATGLALDSNANIIVCGSIINSNLSSTCYVARFTDVGSADNSFGTQGMVTVNLGTYVRGFACAVQPDNKILLAAASAMYPGLTSLYLCRFTTDGVLDTTFGVDGIVTTQLNAMNAPSAILLQSNQIIVIGKVLLNNTSNLLLARYNSNGSIDTTFGNQGTGIVIQSYTNSITANNAFFDLNGNIVVGGSVSLKNSQWGILARFTAQGLLDTSFGASGFIDLSPTPLARADGLVMQPDGKIVISSTSLSGDVILVRLNADGSFDDSFGASGVVDTPLNTMAGAYALAVQSDGNIIAAGGDGCYLVLGYLTSGILDPAYATGGVLEICINNREAIAESVLDTSGNALVFGISSGSAIIARVTPEGALDLSFGHSGLAGVVL